MRRREIKNTINAQRAQERKRRLAPIRLAERQQQAEDLGVSLFEREQIKWKEVQEIKEEAQRRQIYTPPSHSRSFGYGRQYPRY